mmetsp:Transcript_7275/g.15889  ORF Transcript_7275/g.15889 Transcript_7275/m.15889 type:complete len:151 (-) Transcript_7275:967-1419(-)
MKMILGPSTIVVLLSLVTLGIGSPDAACKEWGFNEPKCSDCDSLATFVKDDELAEQCKSCCVREEIVKYTSAVLEICPHWLQVLPELQKFIDHKADSFKDVLKVQMQLNRPPKLKLKSKEHSESVRIDSWKAAQLEEFLKERLVRTMQRA